jgi:hypothetical protein
MSASEAKPNQTGENRPLSDILPLAVSTIVSGRSRFVVAQL